VNSRDFADLGGSNGLASKGLHHLTHTGGFALKLHQGLRHAPALAMGVYYLKNL